MAFEEDEAWLCPVWILKEETRKSEDAVYLVFLIFQWRVQKRGFVPGCCACERHVDEKNVLLYCWQEIN